MTLVRIGDAPPDEIAICIGSLLTTDGIRTLPFTESSAVLIKISDFFASSKACLFVLLFIGIQNTSNKSKVDFLINETIELPISFLVGSSFILGSIFGSFLVFNNE